MRVTDVREAPVVVTGAADPGRLAALGSLLPGSRVAASVPTTLPEPVVPLVVDGVEALGRVRPGDLVDWVRRGGRLLMVGAPPDGPQWREVTGVVAQHGLPRAEYLLSPNGDPLTLRVDEEFPVVGSVVPLEPTGASTLLETVVGARRASVVTRHRFGEGTVTVLGLAGATEALRSASLQTVLRRAVARPSDDADAPSVTLGVGVVGYGPHGSMGYRHGTASQATAGLRFAAVADPDPRRRAAATADFPDVAVHADVAGMLDDDAVDVVVVATPPVSHADIAAQALHAGRHVVVEKPLCLTAADADRLLGHAADADRVLTVHQNRRWDADFLAVRRVVEQGLVGEVFNMETFVGGFEHPCRAWHSDVSVSGGAVYDWGAHHLDWILQLYGTDPQTVQTIAHKRVWHDVTNADQLRVRLRFGDGREAEFVDSMLAAVRRPKFYLQGTEGTLVGQYRPLHDERVDPLDGYVRTDHHHAEAPAELTLARHEPGVGISQTRLALPTPPRHPFHRNLADHLLLGEPLAVTADDARRIVVLLEAAHRSGRCGGDEIRIGA